jgi:CheY-like chemotaxis protein
MMLKYARVLVVEDDVLLARCIADLLEDAGAIVIGPATSVGSALRLLADESIDMASLDIDLGHETSIAIADRLDRSRIPFIYLSGRCMHGLPAPHRSRPFVSKVDLSTKLLPCCRHVLANRRSERHSVGLG